MSLLTSPVTTRFWSVSQIVYSRVGMGRSVGWIMIATKVTINLCILGFWHIIFFSVSLFEKIRQNWYLVQIFSFVGYSFESDHELKSFRCDLFFLFWFIVPTCRLMLSHSGSITGGLLIVSGLYLVTWARYKERQAAPGIVYAKGILELPRDDISPQKRVGIFSGTPGAFPRPWIESHESWNFWKFRSILFFFSFYFSITVVLFREYWAYTRS